MRGWPTGTEEVVDGMMLVGFLEVVRVYVRGEKQVIYQVRKPDGMEFRVSGSNLVQAAWFGWGLANATIGSNGKIFVDDNVPREELPYK